VERERCPVSIWWQQNTLPTLIVQCSHFIPWSGIKWVQFCTQAGRGSDTWIFRYRNHWAQDLGEKFSKLFPLRQRSKAIIYHKLVPAHREHTNVVLPSPFEHFALPRTPPCKFQKHTHTFKRVITEHSIA
jgi:hypothetical protein